MNVRYLLLLLVLSLFACESADTKKHRFLLKGNKELEGQHTDMATQYFNEALRIDSCFADAHNNLGTLYFRQKDYGQAIQYYNQAIGCQPNFLPAYLNRANTFYESGQSERAMADITKVLSVKPDTVPAIFLEGLVYAQRRKYAQATGSFKRVVRLDPQNFEALINLGNVLYYRKHYDSAEQALLKSVQIRPEADAFNTLALIDAARKDYDGARVNIDKALAIRRSDSYYLNNKAYVLLMTGKPEEALSFIDDALAYNAFNSYAYRNKGIYYLHKNDAANAITMLAKAAELDPHTDQVFGYLAEAYALNREPVKACEAYRQAIDHQETPTGKSIACQ